MGCAWIRLSCKGSPEEGSSDQEPMVGSGAGSPVDMGKLHQRP